MSDWLIAVLIGVTFGFVLGMKIARDSNQKEAVRGSGLAHAFHYLASASMSGTLPFIIAGISVGLPFLRLFGTAVGFLVVTLVLLLGYAAFERSAPPAPDTGPLLGE
jgi:hypothetical protein